MAKDAIDGKNQVGNEKNQHKILHHRIYILGAFLLGGVIAAISLWNSDRLLALMLLATFFSIASIYEMRVRDWTAGPIIGFCCICYALAWVLYRVVGPNFPMETDKEAYLIPSNKPTPRGPCDLVSTKQPDGTVAIFAGSNEFWSDVSGQIDILTLDGTPVVTMRKSERGLLFSIEMFNLEKKLVAKISDNKSILIPKNYAYMAARAPPAGRIFQVVLNLTVGRSECDLFDARAIANGLSYAPAVAGSPECHVETTRELGKQIDI